MILIYGEHDFLNVSANKRDGIVFYCKYLQNNMFIFYIIIIPEEYAKILIGQCACFDYIRVLKGQKNNFSELFIRNTFF